jgi:hypothetical protein
MTPAPLPFQTITVGTTANFVVSYENIDRAGNMPYDPVSLGVVQRRAQAILNACEHDYAILCGWFGLPVGKGFGPGNRIEVTLTTRFANGGVLRGAYNLGYQHPSQIFANPYFMNSDPKNDDVVIGLVISELAEVMMSLQGGHWSPSASDGEGLSRVASHLLRPAIVSSFYDPAPVDISYWLTLPPGPNGWTNPFGTTPATLPSHHGTRQDWVSTTFRGENGVPGDADWYSFGCAILFIYYLKDQLGYTMPQIVQAPGDTLEERYRALSGKTGGFTPFKAVLDAFYPTNAPLPQKYDLFPLGGQHCRAALTTRTQRNSAPALVRTTTAKRGTLCGPGFFQYSLYNLNDHLLVDVKTFGFGHPLYAWSVEGHALPDSGSAILTVAAVVAPQDPTVSHGASIQNVTIRATVGTPPGAIVDAPGIEIQVFDNPGHVQLRVDVTVTDQYATGPDAVATSYVIAQIDTQEVDWDPAYDRAAHECASRWKTRHNFPLPIIRRFLPDPPPYLVATAHLLEAARHELRALAEHDPEVAREIDEKFGGALLGTSHALKRDEV